MPQRLKNHWVWKNLPEVALFLSLAIFLLGVLGSRFYAIFNIPALQAAYDKLFWIQLVIWLIFLVSHARAKALTCVVLAAVYFLGYSYLQYFKLESFFPLRAVPRNLGSNVSAEHCWMFAKLYTKRLFFMAIGVLFWGTISAVISNKSRQLRKGALWLVGLITLLVSMIQIQGLWPASQNASGSSIASHRIPALFEDSGAYSVNFGILVTFLLMEIWMARISSYLKAGLIIGAIGALCVIKPYAGSLFLLLPLLSIISLIAIHKCPWTFKPRLGVIISLMMLIYGCLWYCGSEILKHPGERFFLDRYLYAIDPIRGVNWKVMMIGISQHPIFGGGLGSFYSEFDQYATTAMSMGGWIFYDPPGMFYLQIFSEGGLPGLVLMALAVYWIFRNWNNIDILSRIAIVSVAISFLVGIHYLFFSFVMLQIIFASQKGQINT